MAKTEARARAIQLFKDGFKEIAGRQDVTIEELRHYDDALWNRFAPDDAVVEPVDAGGVPALWVSLPGTGSSDRVVVWYHGGGYAVGSAEGRRGLAGDLLRTLDGRVLLPDYRLAPEHPFPAALQD